MYKCPGDVDFKQLEFPKLLSLMCQLRLVSTYSDVVYYAVHVFAWSGIETIPTVNYNLENLLKINERFLSERSIQLTFLQENCDGVLGVPCRIKCDGQHYSNAIIRKCLFFVAFANSFHYNAAID